MSGIRVFATLREALDAGFQVYDDHYGNRERLERDGLIVRRLIVNRQEATDWGFGLVDCSLKDKQPS